MHLPKDSCAHSVAPPQYLKDKRLRLTSNAPVHNEAGIDLRQVLHAAVSRADRQHTLAARRGEHLQFGDVAPLESLASEPLHRGRSNKAPLQQLQVVRTMFVQANPPGFVDAEANTGAPPESVWGAGYLVDLDEHLHAGDVTELLGDEIGLQAPLCTERDVL